MCDSTIPENMTISVITPLFKKGKPYDINNYRPIAYLSQFSKILEKIISNRFLHFIDKHMPNNMVLLEILQLRKHSIILFYYHYNFIESNLERNNKLA